MVSILSLLSSASASPGSFGALHLGASPLQSGTQFAGFGGGVAWAGSSAVAAPVVEAGSALGDRFAVTALAALALPGTPAAPLLVQGRALVVDQDDVRFAVTLSALAIPYFDRQDTNALETHLTPGFAVDAGGEEVRFDASVPIWGVSSFNQYFGIERFPVPLVSTFGVNFAVGEHQRLRVGLPELVSWHYRGDDNVYVDIGGATVLLAGFAWLKVGAAF